jgi:DNA replication protein DnaC
MTQQSLALLFRSLNLPSCARHYQEMADQAESEGWGLTRYLRDLLELELEGRRTRKTERLLKCSQLSTGKTMASLDMSLFPSKIQRQLPALLEGHFLKRAENILAFGLPGRGKTHLVSAIGHELILKGHSVFFTPAYRLVQNLLAAKRELKLEKEMRRLDRFDAVIIDDIGYVQQQQEEMEVLFTFLAERYERRSVLITSNLVFSQWDKIFKDPMTTAAAIDRLVHHCVILELTGPSYRTEKALNKNQVRKMTEEDFKAPVPISEPGN